MNLATYATRIRRGWPWKPPSPSFITGNVGGTWTHEGFYYDWWRLSWVECFARQVAGDKT